MEIRTNPDSCALILLVWDGVYGGVTDIVYYCLCSSLGIFIEICTGVPWKLHSFLAYQEQVIFSSVLSQYQLGHNTPSPTPPSPPPPCSDGNNPD